MFQEDAVHAEEVDGARDLWFAVITSAFNDVIRYDPHKLYNMNTNNKYSDYSTKYTISAAILALNWLTDTSTEEPTSYLWCLNTCIKDTDTIKKLIDEANLLAVKFYSLYPELN